MEESRTLSSWALLIFLGFIWGSSFILMEFALHYTVDGEQKNLMDPLQIAGFRLVLSGLALLPFAIHGLRKVTQKDLFWMAWVGVFGNGIPAFMFPLAQTHLDSGYTGMLNSLTPVFVFLIAIFIFKTKIKRRQIIGLLLGLAGAIGLILMNGIQGDFSIKHSIYVIIATFCYGISVSVMHYKLNHVKAAYIASIALLMTAVPALVYLFAAGKTTGIYGNPEMEMAFIYVLILSVVGTAFALVLFNQLIQKTNSIFASSVTYIIPIFAAGWGIYFHESITLWHLLFGAIIVSGVYLINKK